MDSEFSGYMYAARHHKSLEGSRVFRSSTPEPVDRETPRGTEGVGGCLQFYGEGMLLCDDCPRVWIV